MRVGQRGCRGSIPYVYTVNPYACRRVQPYIFCPEPVLQCGEKDVPTVGKAGLTGRTQDE
jgi:hypothetical protein